MRLRAIRSSEGRIIDFDCLDSSPDLMRQGVPGLLPTRGKRLLDEAPWVAECSLFDACARVAERQVPEVERFGRTTPAGIAWLLARMAPCEGGLTLFLEDFTRRVESEAALRRDRDLLHAVIQSTTDAVFVKDLSGRYVLLNPAAAKAFGRPAPEVIGRTDVELLGAEAAAATVTHDQAVCESGQTATYEDADGGPGFGCVWQSTKGVLRHPDGRAYGLFGISRDVTVRRRQEEEREQEGRFRERFIGVLGHDLGNPLAAIRLSAAAMLAKDTLTPDVRRVMQRIDASAERMARLVKQLLDFTRARMAGGIPLRPGEMALEEVCRRIIAELELAYPNRDIHLEIRGESKGFWDEERMAQVLSNLVANALQHSPVGTPVSVRLESVDSLQRVAVHNVGQPIPEALRPHLFEPFHHSEGGPGRASRGGLGLGLYIVAQIVQAHGGRIEVDSSSQEGTSFVLLLPRSVPAPAGTVEDERSQRQQAFGREGTAARS
ncbi:PAS domain-containing sensor histidine kinase [Hyalangium rubrum]|uniref:histidine kinase n=1 Tax=Hyalangium rubrum TaxID=3103134 RepID=A0ABU5H0U5_9BACT|nr:PAS domain-containing sensor histidine kinase [Hyalangium sp. s54d21]MDY7227078.1 PAS domain-containing sensor histidine kinase [Hyalangium sp. s54d21]